MTKIDAATRDSPDQRAAGARVVVHDVIRRRNEGEAISDATVEAEHAELMPELADDLEKARRLKEAHRQAECDPSALTEEYPKPGEPHTPISLTPPSKPDDKLLANLSIPGYTILRCIGQGGMGAVYQAVRQKTSQTVAIKVLLGGPIAGPRDRRRFDLEVQTLARLSHPNIVAVHDSGEANGHPYFVMDYIPGQPLDAYLKSRQLSIDSIIELFRTICDAVNAAHIKGVTHRDLKPGNILVTDDATPHVLDFGLAKVATEHVMDGSGAFVGTRPDRFIGTLPWASPEQAEGRPDKVDIRSDVYSLGVILFQMLTKRFPYDVAGNLHDVIENILSVEPARPRSFRREISDDLQTIVLACLDKLRDRRYQSAGELRDEIDRYRKGLPLPISRKSDSVWYVFRKLAVRNKFAAAVLGLVGVILASSTFVSAHFYLRESDAQADFELQVKNFESRKEGFEGSIKPFKANAAHAATGYAELKHWTSLQLFLALWRKGLDHDAQDVAASLALRAAPFDAAVQFLLDDKPLKEKVEHLRARLDQSDQDGGSDEARWALAGLVIGEQHARDGNATAAVMSLVDARKAILGKSGPRELWLDDLIRKRLTTLEYGETAR